MVDEMAPGSGEPSRSVSSASPAGREIVLKIAITREDDGSTEGTLVAQCFPQDIVAQGKTMPVLLHRLAAVWHHEERYALTHGQPIPLHPAARKPEAEDTQRSPQGEAIPATPTTPEEK